MKTHQEYTNYFEAIAVNHKSILHKNGGDTSIIKFFRVNKWDFKNSLATAISPLILLNPKHTKSIGGMANPTKEHFGSLSILKIADSINDFTQQDAAQTFCESIALDVEQKLINDKRKGLLKGLDMESIEIQPEGPLEGKYWGVHISFSWTTASPVLFEENKWNNETAFV